MIRGLAILLTVLTLVSMGAFTGALFHEQLYTIVQPCSISKWFGPTDRERNLNIYESMKWRVVDGDTLWCERRRIRLTGFDAPEPRSNQAQCDHETELGKRAKTSLKDLLAGRNGNNPNWNVIATGKQDSHERALATLIVNGKPVQDTLINQGLAKFGSIQTKTQNRNGATPRLSRRSLRDVDITHKAIHHSSGAAGGSEATRPAPIVRALQRGRESAVPNKKCHAPRGAPGHASA